MRGVWLAHTGTISVNGAWKVGQCRPRAVRQTGSEATLSNISIGLDAGTLTEDPGTTGAAGTFREQADTVTIDNLNQDTWLTTVGAFTLPDLRLGFGGSC
jgi:hypothetical protein